MSKLLDELVDGKFDSIIGKPNKEENREVEKRTNVELTYREILVLSNILNLVGIMNNGNCDSVMKKIEKVKERMED